MAEEQSGGSDLLPYITPGMAVYDKYNEPLGTIERILPDEAIIEVETERWKDQHYRVRADQVMSVGFSRIRLRATGAELEKS
jgi:hypothetical protein